MIIRPDFLTHWKFQALCAAIGRAEAFTALLALWGHCQTSKGYVFPFTPRMLAGVCQFQGDAKVLLDTMVELHLLDPLNQGHYEVHGWAENNSTFIKNWTNGAKGGDNRRTAPQRRNGEPAGEPQTLNRDTPPPPQTGDWATPAIPEGLEGVEGIECIECVEGSPGGSRASSISWNPDSGWIGFTPQLRASLEKAFPGRDLDMACNESDAWLRQKPANARKKNWFSFLTNWLRRTSPILATGYEPEQGGNPREKKEGAGHHIAFQPPAPSGPWRGCFHATYGQPYDGDWEALPPAVQREIRHLLTEAATHDPLMLGHYAEKERGEAA